MILKYCDYCGKRFKTINRSDRNQKHYFCSRNCFDKYRKNCASDWPGTFKKGHVPWHKGKTGVYSQKTLENISRNNARFWLGKKRSDLMTKKVKKKLSKIHKGKKLSESHKQHIKENNARYWLGKKRPEIGLKMKGNKNPAWMDGKSLIYLSEFNKELKEKIRKRDNYVCQLSGKTEDELREKLAVHHIDYDKKNNQERNLISLSRSSNSKVNFGREDWTKYFQSKLERRFL